MTEEIKEILQEVNKIIDNTSYNEDITYFEVSHISKLLDYITNLQQENEKLKEQLQNKGIIKTCENCEWFGTCPHSYREYDYKSRCEKAIEYINHENFKRTILVGVGTKKYTRNILDNVLNILNGSD